MIEQLYKTYKDKAFLYVLYIREAHPIDGWKMPINSRDNVLITDPKTLEERQKVAHDFATQFKLSVPILVDTIDDQVQNAYAAWPDRIYVINEGRIIYKGDVGPRGFKVNDVPPVLDKLLAAATATHSGTSPSASASNPTTRTDTSRPAAGSASANKPANKSDSAGNKTPPSQNPSKPQSRDANASASEKK